MKPCSLLHSDRWGDIIYHWALYELYTTPLLCLSTLLLKPVLTWYFTSHQFIKHYKLDYITSLSLPLLFPPILILNNWTSLCIAAVQVSGQNTAWYFTQCKSIFIYLWVVNLVSEIVYTILWSLLVALYNYYYVIL